MVANAAAGSASEATTRMGSRSRFMSGWRHGIGNAADSEIPPAPPPLFPNTGDPRITCHLTMMCKRGSKAAPCLHATSPAHTRHAPRRHRRHRRGDPDTGRIRRVGHAHHVPIRQQRAAPDHRQRRLPGRPPRDRPGESGRPPLPAPQRSRSHPGVQPGAGGARQVADDRARAWIATRPAGGRHHRRPEPARVRLVREAPRLHPAQRHQPRRRRQ